MPEWLQAWADFILPGNAFHACVAVGPLAIYLLLIGAINLARRPLLVSGTRDAAALGLALSGLLLVGPVDLFFPNAITMHVILLVRLLLLGFYVMCLVLVLLLLRPRLVIYNISVDQLRPVLAELVDKLDREARWAGDSLVLPGLGVQLHLDSFAPLRNVSLAAVGAKQNYLGWRQLEVSLRAALSKVEGVRNRAGAAILLGVGALLVAWLVGGIANDPQAVAQRLLETLNL
jgi:hypothetical protein